jgi:hypothetical protein
MKQAQLVHCGEALRTDAEGKAVVKVLQVRYFNDLHFTE